MAEALRRAGVDPSVMTSSDPGALDEAMARLAEAEAGGGAAAAERAAEAREELVTAMTSSLGDGGTREQAEAMVEAVMAGPGAAEGGAEVMGALGRDDTLARALGGGAAGAGGDGGGSIGRALEAARRAAEAAAAEGGAAGPGAEERAAKLELRRRMAEIEAASGEPGADPLAELENAMRGAGAGLDDLEAILGEQDAGSARGMLESMPREELVRAFGSVEAAERAMEAFADEDGERLPDDAVRAMEGLADMEGMFPGTGGRGGGQGPGDASGRA